LCRQCQIFGSATTRPSIAGDHPGDDANDQDQRAEAQAEQDEAALLPKIELFVSDAAEPAIDGKRRDGGDDNEDRNPTGVVVGHLGPRNGALRPSIRCIPILRGR